MGGSRGVARNSFWVGIIFLLHDTTVLYTSSLTTSAAISAQNNFQGLILGGYIYRYTPRRYAPGWQIKLCYPTLTCAIPERLRSEFSQDKALCKCPVYLLIVQLVSLLCLESKKATELTCNQCRLLVSEITYDPYRSGSLTTNFVI